MKVQHPLFSQVALAEDLPEYSLKRGDIGTVVEHYPMPDGEDGYSVEGFYVSQITIEVAASQIMSVAQWQQEEALLAQQQEEVLLVKLRQLSKTRLLQLEEYLDFLLQKETSEKKAIKPQEPIS